MTVAVGKEETIPRLHRDDGVFRPYFKLRFPIEDEVNDRAGKRINTQHMIGRDVKNCTRRVLRAELMHN